MASEGYPFAAVSLILTITTLLSGAYYDIFAVEIGGWFLAVLTLFVIFFFRDPERKLEIENNEIVSPGDGLIVSIAEEKNEDFFNTDVMRISVFLSVFDVHINRVPIGGRVEFFEYRKGKFKAAFKKEASDLNEQTVIGISNEYGKVLFKQIAGLIARRIICTLEKGQEVMVGQRCGLIRFGSRVDIVVPLDVEILVKKGDRVAGGKTIIGRFTNEA